MGKGTNFSGQPVLSQLIKLMDRQKINTLASKSGANYYTKHLDGYSHLVVMLDAVLSNLRSLRETCLGFAANATRMNHLGIDLPVFVDYTEGIVHDHEAMERLFDLPYGSFIAFDMGFRLYAVETA